MDEQTRQILSLLSEYGAELHALFIRITLCEDIAEDLLQELFLRLHRRKGFTAIQKPKAYMFTAATRLAFDWRRAQRRRRDQDILSVEPAGDSSSDTSRSERLDELQSLLDDIGRLPRQSREIVVMRYLGECSYEEIASELGKSSHQVRALCHKTISKLRKLQEDKPRDSRANQ